MQHEEDLLATRLRSTQAWKIKQTWNFRILVHWKMLWIMLTMLHMSCR